MQTATWSDTMILNKYYVQFPRLCINALRVQMAVEGSHSKKSYLCASDAVLLRCSPPSNLCTEQFSCVS